MNRGVHTYGYDWQGNRLSATNGAAGAVYVPDGLNQYDDVGGVAPMYDLDGNLLLIPGRMSMAYDAKNQMTFCSNAAYRVWNTYDHLGRRIGKETKYLNNASSTRHYLYDGWNLIAETMPSGAPSHYLWGLDISGSEQGAGGIGGLLAVFRDGSWHIPLADANGNVTSYIDGQGAVGASYAYDAFGGTIAQSGSMAGAFAHRFSTKYLDTETGLYYYGRRFYDPVWGRWINRDPIEEGGGLNLYGFCGNNGVNGVDLLGMEGVSLYKIHAIGDSMTYGVRTINDPFPVPKDPKHIDKLNKIENQGWRGFLSAKLEEWGKNVNIRFEFLGKNTDGNLNVMHDGYPGDRTSAIIGKIKDGKIVCKEADIYILLIGMNDVIAIHQRPKQSWPQHFGATKANYESILDEIVSDEPRHVLLGTLPKVTAGIKKPYSADKMNAVIVDHMNPFVKETAAKNKGGEVFDLENLFEEDASRTDDGYHFSIAGNQKVAEILFEKITQRISTR